MIKSKFHTNYTYNIFSTLYKISKIDLVRAINQDSLCVNGSRHLGFGDGFDIDCGQAILLAPGVGETHLFCKSMLAQFVLDASSIFVVLGCQLQSFLYLMLLFFDEKIIGLANSVVDFLVVLKVGEIKDGMRKFLVLEVGKVRLGCSPRLEGSL